LVEIFYDTQSLKKDTGVADADVRGRPVQKLAVLGGGLMGSGIAYVSADKGLDVRIKERDHSASAHALGLVYDLVAGRLKRKALNPREAETLMSHVTATTELTGFNNADLIIEAVFEDLALKQQLLQQLEAITRDECVFASNTSSLPITKIATVSRRPEQVLGMHFFSPVNKMPLLEVIVTDRTGAQATATAVELGKRLGKQVIVVKDGVGFYTSRILAPYLNEAAHLLAEGASIEAIDRALMDFGFPVGPITLMDEVGIDVGAKVALIMHDAYGERMKPVEALSTVIGDNRMGRKNKRGFYTYEDKKKKKVDESVYELLPGGKKRRSVPIEELQQRIALQMVNEAMLCFGEGILRSARDGDIGAIFGLGFPPFLGGPFRYVDVHGASQVVQDLKRLREKHGLRFEPAPALLDAAKNHRTFREG
jgi:3-hydroxyacyl-CoA dehydrogenase / enoyl-CoA hydratase / 3-hydroxybutyryl-CoA epimerase